jgi:hypothetical protein
MRSYTVWVYLRATLNQTTAWAASQRWWRWLASATVSNAVGMIGTEAGLSVQTAAMKLQWCVSPTNILPTGCQPFPVTVLSISIDQLDKADAPLIPEAYIYLLGMRCLVSLSDGLAGYIFPLYNTLAV